MKMSEENLNVMHCTFEELEGHLNASRISWGSPVVKQWIDFHKEDDDFWSSAVLGVMMQEYFQEPLSALKDFSFILYLEQLVDENKTYRQLFTAWVAADYCENWKVAAREGEPLYEMYCQLCEGVLGRLMEKGENLIQCLCREIEETGQYFFVMAMAGDVCDDFLKPLMEIVGEDAGMDLADLEYCYNLLFQNGFDDEGKGRFLPKHRPYEKVGEELLCWAAKHLTFTNREKRRRFVVQEFVVSHSTKADLFLMRQKGFFPEETMEMLVFHIRQGEWRDKLPILIQWLHER